MHGFLLNVVSEFDIGTIEHHIFMSILACHVLYWIQLHCQWFCILSKVRLILEFLSIPAFQVCLHMFSLDFLNQVASGLEKDSMLVMVFYLSLSLVSLIFIQHGYVNHHSCNQTFIFLMQNRFKILVALYLAIKLSISAIHQQSGR